MTSDTGLQLASKRRRPPTFGHWLRRKRRQGVAFVVGIAGALSGAAALKNAPLGTWAGGLVEYAVLMPYLLHVVVILLFMGFLVRSPKRPRQDKPEYERAHRALMQFMGYWRLVWTSWLLMYLVATTERYLHVKGLPDGLHNLTWHAVYELVFNTLDNAQTAAMFLCYFVLTWDSLREDKAAASVEYRDEVPTHLVFGSVALLFMAEVLYLIASAPNYEFRHVFSLASGFMAGAVIAMTVGRLESKFIGAHPLLVLCLYVYALVQTMVPAFHMPAYPHLQDVVIVFALACKVLLFVFVYWLIHEGRLLFYMTNVHHLNRAVETQWQEFEEALRDRRSA